MVQNRRHPEWHYLTTWNLGGKRECDSRYMTLDGKDNGYDEKCANALEVPDVVVGTDIVTSEDPIPSYAYGWTAQAAAIYYVHVMSASGDSKAKFYLTLGT